MSDFEQRLTGGHPNSLGNTVVIVEEVLEDPGQFKDLFACYFSDDEVIRLRVSNAMKRICKERPDLLIPYLDRFLTEVARIEQASTQWTLATLFDWLWKDMSVEQQQKALEIGKRNLESWSDWIVLNTTMDFLGKRATADQDMRQWFGVQLQRLVTDDRKSVAKKAGRWRNQLEKGRRPI